MYRCEAENTFLQAAQHMPCFIRISLTDLHVHDRRYQLQVVLDPVVHFLEQDILIAQTVLQLRLIAQNGFAHTDKRRLHVAQFNRHTAAERDARQIAVQRETPHLPAQFADVTQGQIVQRPKGNNQAGDPHDHRQKRTNPADNARRQKG